MAETTAAKMDQAAHELREIIPIDHAGPPPPGAPPRLEWLPLEVLRVNPVYQRATDSAASKANIRALIDQWDWAKVKALSVQPVGDLYEITDGQHTAIAAATLGIASLPALINAEGGTVAAAAGAFVGINAGRVTVPALSIFWAKVAAGDETALEVTGGARRAGARILRSARKPDDYKIGDTIAIKRLSGVARNGGAVYVERVLKLGVDCGLAPICVKWVRVFELLLWGGPEFEPRASLDEIADTVIGVSNDVLEAIALQRCSQSKRPQYVELAHVIRDMIRRRGAAA